MKQQTIYLKLLWALVFITAGVISFLLFSPRYCTWLHSDHAVQILMCADIYLPEDLYYWGQSRLGAIVPLLGNVLFEYLNIEPVWAVSIVNYSFFIWGVFFIALIFSSYWIKISWVILFFLPVPAFTTWLELGYPQGTAFGVFSIVIFLYWKYFYGQQNKIPLWVYAVIPLLSGIAIWISDPVIMPFGLLSFLILYKSYKLEKRIKPAEYASYILTSSIMALLISYAKNNSSEKHELYGKLPLNNLLQVEEVLLAVYSRILGVLSGESNFFTIILVLLILVLILGIPFLFYLFKNKKERSPAIFFLICSFLLFLAPVFSNWVHINFNANRYFVDSYMYFLLFALWSLDKISDKGRYYLIALLLAILSPLSLLYDKGGEIFEKSTYSRISELKVLGECAFLGVYWNSYIMGIADPENQIAAAKDPDWARSYRQVQKVLLKERVYLVGNDWLEEFPEKINQFGWVYQKAAPPFELAGYRLALYHKIIQSAE